MAGVTPFSTLATTTGTSAPAAPLPGRGAVTVIAGALTDEPWMTDEQWSAALAARPVVAKWLARFRERRVHHFEREGPVIDELAHERWLRDWLDQGWRGARPAPGRIAAARALAALRRRTAVGCLATPRPPWLAEPTHIHVATDHLVLLHGAAATLSSADAATLLAAARPLFDEIGIDCEALAPRTWLLWHRTEAGTGAAAAPSPLPPSPRAAINAVAPSAETAQGHNVDAYLPRGPEGRSLRRLFNAIQMAWHEHPVNAARTGRGEVTINSIWISGPCTVGDVAAWQTLTSRDRLVVDDGPLWPRLNADRDGWAERLVAALERSAAALPPVERLILCGERGVRELATAAVPRSLGAADDSDRNAAQRRNSSASTAPPAGSMLARLRSFVGRIGRRHLGHAPSAWFVEPR